MKIVVENLDREIDFSVSDAWELVIENPALFYSITKKLINLTEGLNEEGITLVENCQETSFAKSTEVLYNFYDLEINNKKIQTLVSKHLLEVVKENDFYLEIEKINQSIIEFYTKLSTMQELDLIFDPDVSIENIIKLANFKFEENGDLAEQLINYIDMLNKLRSLKIVIFINAFSILSQDNLIQLIKQMRYFGLKCLFINSNQRYKIASVKTIVIDEDLCEI